MTEKDFWALNEVNYHGKGSSQHFGVHFAFPQIIYHSGESSIPTRVFRPLGTSSCNKLQPNHSVNTEEHSISIVPSDAWDEIRWELVQAAV